MAKAKKAKNCLFGITQAVSWPSEDNPNPKHEEWAPTRAFEDVWDVVFSMPYFNKGEAEPAFGNPCSYWGWEPVN